MARPRNCRLVESEPNFRYFKPAGIPVSRLSHVILTVDEYEAIRLADLEGLYQEDASRRMNVSRQTFGRIIESARRKLAEILVYGKVLKIEGGDIEMVGARKFKCYACNHVWELPFGSGPPDGCPKCHEKNFHRIDEAAGLGRGSGKGAGGGGGGTGMGRGGGAGMGRSGGSGMGRGGGGGKNRSSNPGMNSNPANESGTGGGRGRGKRCGVKIEQKKAEKGN